MAHEGEDWLDDDEYPMRPLLSHADANCLRSAKGALRAWIDLPRARREDPLDLPAQALFDSAFGLMTSPAGKEELAQFGADMSLEDDDAKALSGFLALGAHYPPAALRGPDHARYVDTWSSSMAHHCAKRGSIQCLAHFLADGTVARDAAVAAAAFEEPAPSVLRSVDRAVLDKALARDASAVPEGPAREAIESGHDLILELLGATASQSERLGLSIAHANLRQGNPLHVMLGRESRDRNAMGKGAASQGPDSNLHRTAFALADAGLFDPASLAHRAAMLSLAVEGSPPAAALAARAGLDPSMGGPEVEESFKAALLNPKGLLGLPPALRALCQAWAARPEFGQALFDEAASAALWAARVDPSAKKKQAGEEWPILRKLNPARALCAAAAFPDRGFVAPSQESIEAFLAGVDAALLADPKRPSSVADALRGLGEDLGALCLAPPKPGPRL